MAVIGATQIQPVNFLEEYAKGLQVGAGRRQLERQEIDRIKAAEQQRALNELYSRALGPTGQVDVNQLYRNLATQGMGGMIPGLQAQQAEIAQKTAAAGKSSAEADKIFWETSRNELAAIPDNNQAAYQAWANRLISRAPWTAQMLPPILNAQTKLQLLMTADAALPKGEVTDVGGGTAVINQYTGQQIGTTIKDVIDPTVIARAGAARTQVNSFIPASETAQTEFIKEFRDTYKQLKTAPVDIANLRRAAELAQTEGRKYMGTGGQAFLSAAKFLKNRLGVDIDAKALADAEEARTVLFQNVLGNLRKLDAQPSQQQQFIMQEALGNLDTDPDALPRVVQVYEDVIRGRVEQHNREFAEMKANPNLANAFPYSLEIKLPPAVTVTGPGGRPLGATADQPIKVKTPAELNALPPGSLYIGPDGKTRRKPNG